MQLTRKTMNMLANKEQVKECLAFRPDLPPGHHKTFVLLFTVVLNNGEVFEGPLRADNGNIREIRDPKRVIKTALRFGVPGVSSMKITNEVTSHGIAPTISLRQLPYRVSIRR